MDPLLDEVNDGSVVREHARCSDNMMPGIKKARPLPISSRVERTQGAITHNGAITRNMVCSRVKEDWCKTTGQIQTKNVQTTILNAQNGTFRLYETALLRKADQNQQRMQATCGKLVQLANYECS